MSLHYHLRCSVCARTFVDDGLVLECESEHALCSLVTEYTSSKFEPDEDHEGIYRYRRWLPIRRSLACAGGTVTFQSRRLCRFTGLRNLWIAFNGYWPERGARLETSTFKELEAITVLGRLPQNGTDVLVVPSAGSTAAAFALLCSDHQVPCLIIIPVTGLQRMWFSRRLHPCVKIVSLVGYADYNDAIHLARRMERLPGFVSEGGFKNVGRRDGIGTTLLNAVEAMGRLPDYYFQAVGSGTGGVAIHEAAKRLVTDGRFGHTLPRLMLSQNLPFDPMHQAWKVGQRELTDVDYDKGKWQLKHIVAEVLSNQQPPYSPPGGVFDALTESKGDMLVADNAETLQAVRLMRDMEGIDIDPAAGVAIATLLKETRGGLIDPNSHVLLHLTGGGYYRRTLDQRLVPAEPALQIDGRTATSTDAVDKVVTLFH